jgi:hypothetical protein
MEFGNLYSDKKSVKRVNQNQTRKLNEGDVTMKKLLMAGLVALAPSASMAADDSEGIGLSLDVADQCILDDWDGPGGIALITFQSSGDGTFTSTTKTLQAANAHCNFGAVTMTLASDNGSIDSGKGAVDGFVNELPYTVSGNWGANPTFANIKSGDITGGTVETVVDGAVGPISGLLTINVTPEGSDNKPLLAGGYADKLTVKLSAK